jgi:hypothetical protein
VNLASANESWAIRVQEIHPLIFKTLCHSPEIPFHKARFMSHTNDALPSRPKRLILLKAPQHCPPIVCARLLGHLLCLAPTGNGQGQLQREIALATDDPALMQVAGVYLSLIRACKPQPFYCLFDQFWPLDSQAQYRTDPGTIRAPFSPIVRRFS